MWFSAPVEIKVALVTGLVTLIAGVPNAIAVLDKDSTPAKQTSAQIPHPGTGNEVGLPSCVTVHQRALTFINAHRRLRLRYAMSGDAARQGLAPLNSAQEAYRCGSSERLIEAEGAPAALK